LTLRDEVNTVCTIFKAVEATLNALRWLASHRQPDKREGRYVRVAR
jgi:hypothetical protein